jgi:hypothetical protein
MLSEALQGGNSVIEKGNISYIDYMAGKNDMHHCSFFKTIFAA